MLGLLSAEGAGFDLSSFKVVILEGSIAEGGEANVLAGERVFGESKCSFAFFFFPRLHFLPNFPLQNRPHLSFSNGCRVCV